MSKDELEAIATARHHLRKAESEIATDGGDSSDYHLFQAFTALGDYVQGSDEWTVVVDQDEEGDENE